MTDEEFQLAYNAALQIVTPLAGKSREEQLLGIAIAVRNICDSGLVYSTSNAHYNDPYGYFILCRVCEGNRIMSQYIGDPI